MALKKIQYFADDTSSIAIIHIGKQDEAELHDHEFHELVIVFSGTGIHYTDDEEYQICAGDVFLVKPGHSHGYRDTDKLDLLNILYLPKKMKIPLMDMKDISGYHAFFELEPKMRKQHNFKSRLNLPATELKKVKYMVETIEKELQAGIPGKNYLCCAYFMQLQCFIARSYSNIKSAEGMTVIGIADLITYMEKKYQTHITLEKLAKIANMSKSTLNRNFLQATGLSPVKYLINIRILKAADILRTGRENVTETAFNVGFNDSNYFVRQFRKIMGISPGKYRNNK